MTNNHPTPHDHFFRSMMVDPQVVHEFFTTHLPDKIKDIVDIQKQQIDQLLLYGTLVQVMRDIHKYRKNTVPLLKEIIVKLKKIENLGNISYIITAIRYLFEAGEADLKEFTDVIQNLKKTGKAMSLAEQLITEGYDKGILAGIIKGKTEGKLEGKLEGRAEVALKLLQQKIAPTIIAEWTGISLDEILKLKQSIKS